MQSTQIKQITQTTLQRSFIILAIILIIAVISGLALKFIVSPKVLTRVSIDGSGLARQYGLQVNLVAVTAAGGMVDVRLKFNDAEKAKALLQDKKNFPALLVKEGSLTLNVDADTKAQTIKFENNGDMFLLFPNSGNAVKQGDPVTVLFGDLALEPITAK